MKSLRNFAAATAAGALLSVSQAEAAVAGDSEWYALDASTPVAAVAANQVVFDVLVAEAQGGDLEAMNYLGVLYVMGGKCPAIIRRRCSGSRRPSMAGRAMRRTTWPACTCSGRVSHAFTPTPFGGSHTPPWAAMFTACIALPYWRTRASAPHGTCGSQLIVGTKPGRVRDIWPNSCGLVCAHPSRAAP
jgi:hypothetical protein